MNTYGKIFAIVFLIIYLTSLCVSFSIGSKFKINRFKSTLIGLLITSVIFVVVFLALVLIDQTIIPLITEDGFIFSIHKSKFILPIIAISIIFLLFSSYKFAFKKLTKRLASKTDEIDEIGSQVF